MTNWMFVGIWFGMAAYAIAWFQGGRPERIAAGVLLCCCMLSSIVYDWRIGGVHLADMALDFGRFLILGWLCLRSNRWWLFLTTTALGLMMVTHALGVLVPTASAIALVSAQVGLGYLVDLSLMFSVFERRLAGDAPGGPAAWVAADTATKARRKRRNVARLTGAFPTAPRSGEAIIPWKESGARRFPPVLSRFAEKG